MPTGLTDSPNLFPTNIPQKTTSLVPQDAVNETITVVIKNTGVPQNCVPFKVPERASVNVRGQNGTSAGNAAPVFVGLSPEELLNGGGRMVTPDTEIFYPVDWTHQIWVRGNAGDGVQVFITANPVY